MKRRHAFVKSLLLRQLSNYHIKQDSSTQAILDTKKQKKVMGSLERKLPDFFLFPWTYIL